MPFGVLNGDPNVITYAKFDVNRLMGCSAAAPPIVSFLILVRTNFTTVPHYRADCDHQITCITLPAASIERKAKPVIAVVTPAVAAGSVVELFSGVIEAIHFQH